MTDVVHLDVPLFIRLIELAREEVKQDADLHDIAEKVISISQQRVATMADYDSIVSFMKSQGEPAAASEPKEEFTAEDADTEFDDIVSMITRIRAAGPTQQTDSPAGYSDRDVHRFKQIVDLAGQQTISTQPQEQYAGLDSITVDAGKENMNGAKEPEDLRGNSYRIYGSN
jgi:hypothetical protein